MVSHELRTPLTSIWGSVMAMLDGADDLDPAEQRQFLRIILEQAANMRDLIGGLLDVARIETGELPVNPGAGGPNYTGGPGAEHLPERRGPGQPGN